MRIYERRLPSDVMSLQSRASGFANDIDCRVLDLELAKQETAAAWAVASSWPENSDGEDAAIRRALLIEAHEKKAEEKLELLLSVVRPDHELRMIISNRLSRF